MSLNERVGTDRSTIPISAVAALIDCHAISDLAVEYTHAADRHDGDAVAAMFTPDGVMSVLTGDGDRTELIGPAMIAGRLSALDRYRFTSHSVADHIVSVDGDRAEGRSRCTAHHFADADGSWFDRVAYLRYVDDYVRVDGRWMFEHRTVHIDVEEQRPIELYHWPDPPASDGADPAPGTDAR